MLSSRRTFLRTFVAAGTAAALPDPACLAGVSIDTPAQAFEKLATLNRFKLSATQSLINAANGAVISPHGPALCQKFEAFENGPKTPGAAKEILQLLEHEERFVRSLYTTMRAADSRVAELIKTLRPHKESLRSLLDPGAFSDPFHPQRPIVLGFYTSDSDYAAWLLRKGREGGGLYGEMLGEVVRSLRSCAEAVRGALVEARGDRSRGSQKRAENKKSLSPKPAYLGQEFLDYIEAVEGASRSVHPIPEP